MAAAATDVAGMMGEIAAAAEDHRAGLEDMRTKLVDQLKELAKDLGTEVLIGVGLSIVTAGFGAAVAAARATNAVRKFAGPIRNLITAFKSLKLAKGVKTTHQATNHQPTLKQLASLKPQKAPSKQGPRPPSPPAALTDKDKQAINAYTGIDNQFLNGALRNPDVPMDDYMRARVDDLNQALGKLPNYEGPVVRHTDLPDDVLARYVPGERVTEQGFTSTSRAIDGSPHHNGNPVEFQIMSSTGKEVTQYSKNPEELEVLFQSGTPFHVVSRQDVGGRTVIRMVEVPR